MPRRRLPAAQKRDATREAVSNEAGDDAAQKGAAQSKPWSPHVVFGIITLVIGLPRGVQLAYDYIHLHSGLIRLPVPLDQERAVLIVGTMASGTKQMSSELGKLNLEVAHENSDSSSNPARDGTISWIHGIRFAPGKPSVTAAAALCSEPRFHAFHPTMFRPSQNCSYYFTVWDRCWSVECADLWSREYGCALPKDENGGISGTPACTTPFAKTLLQVRHPLRTLASLVAKSEPDCQNGKHQLATVRAMFPAFAWGKLSSCEETWGWYWVLYHDMALQHVDAWYSVETTPPCTVAEMSGLLKGAAAEVCAARAKGEGPGHGEAHGYMNRKNVGKRSLSWEQMERYPDGLADNLRRLAGEFGYLS